MTVSQNTDTATKAVFLFSLPHACMPARFFGLVLLTKKDAASTIAATSIQRSYDVMLTDKFFPLWCLLAYICTKRNFNLQFFSSHAGFSVGFLVHSSILAS